MSDQPPTSADIPRRGLPLALQWVAWILCMAACVVGMLDLVAEWSLHLATVQLVVLAAGPVIGMLRPRRRSRGAESSAASLGACWLWCLLLGAISFGVSFGMGTRMAGLPPAYHDEFSYLFQAQTLLDGKFSVPSHPQHPELFDQMHVLNEGRMASRYYPGTGLWLAPFVAAGTPYLGSWIAGALSTMLIFWAGREIGGLPTGCFAGLAMALSPGIGLFGNTLLAHHPTLLALSLFLLGVIRWRRTRGAADAWTAGCGLSLAMLCRPMTAAAVGLPFGLDIALWLTIPRPRTAGESPAAAGGTSQQSPRFRPVVACLAGFGVPLLFGWGIMLSYNRDVTGQWLTSPYQLYTDLYTPRHVYGFNNVVRGEQHLGPKVIDYYDRWAENLTPELAVRNGLTRWISSWLGTLDLPVLLGSFVLILGALPRLDRRWLLVVAAILSLHLLHLPYWYVGIMGWHYVFESAALWCLILGGVTGLLLADWRSRGQTLLPWWWCLMLTVSIAGAYVVPCPRQGVAARQGNSRVERGLNALEHPRRKHAEMRRWIERNVDRPALVLLDQESTVGTHLDLVVNDPGLNGNLLLGRYRPGVTEVGRIRRDFPDRAVYLANPERRTIQRIE